MADYARDIATGDRTALARRYDPAGAFLLGAGSLQFAPHRQIADDYAKLWAPPSSFEWRDLRFAATGSDVVVSGHFVWRDGKGGQMFTYTGLLRRRHGRLVIRLEEETPEPDGGH